MNTIVFDYYNTLYNPKTGRLFSGTICLLKQLQKSFKLILITTATPRRWEQINRLGLYKYFSQIILCRQKDSLLFKPYASPSTLVIGDRPRSEIGIGKKLKCLTLQIRSGKQNPISQISSFLNL